MEEKQDNPFTLFKEWYEEWQKADFAEPDAVTLASCGKDGMPSARVVLMRDYNEGGFIFHTNYASDKGKQLDENPKAALCFYWEETGKQVRVEGVVEKLSDKESDKYFEGRPRGSQIAAWASKQSKSMKDPMDLPNRVQEIVDSFKDEPIPRPPFWGGYRVIPEMIEFWQRGEHRLHVRLCYRRVGSKWETELLYP